MPFQNRVLRPPPGRFCRRHPLAGRKKNQFQAEKLEAAREGGEVLGFLAE
jgi:hypothetical protein